MRVISAITRNPIEIGVIRGSSEEGIADLWGNNLLNDYSDKLLLSDLLKRFKKTADDFIYHYPFTVWTQGLIIEPEMHRQSELYLPLERVEKLFSNFFNCIMKPPTDGFNEQFRYAHSWQNILESIDASQWNPYTIIAESLDSRQQTVEFISQWYIRSRHGEKFLRYKEQSEWIRGWLAGRGKEAKVLDAACGTGEGVYDLVHLASESGFHKHLLCLGESLSSPEILSAATGYIPHDKKRSSEYGLNRNKILDSYPEAEIYFRQRDITKPAYSDSDKFDLILCNGLIGGPAMDSIAAIDNLLDLILYRVADQGTLLIDDRFHHGWEKRFSKKMLMQRLGAKGFQTFQIGSGIGCKRV